MMDFKFDPAYLQLLDTNRELCEELGKEVDINQANEKKICVLIKEVESCHKNISFQDNTIIAHEVEIQELKYQISDLQKKLRKALKHSEQKESFISNQELQISNLEVEVEKLKNRIREISSRKFNKKDITDMDHPIRPPHRGNTVSNNFNTIQQEVNNIRFYIQNPNQSALLPADILNKLGLIWTSAHQLHQLNEQVARLQRDLKASEDEKDLWILAHREEVNKRRSWHFSYKDKHRRVSELLREKFATQLLVHNYKH